MSDNVFKVSLSTLFCLVSVLVMAGIVLGAMGMPWFYTDLPALVFFTLLTGLIVLILGGSALLYVWGKHYMAKG